MTKKIYLLLMSLVLIFAFACKKEGVSLIDIGLRDKPSEKKGNFKWVKGINRGQVIKILEEQKDGDWVKVQLPDGISEGWVQKNYVHIGKKYVLEFNKAEKVYDQPDADSKVIMELPEGQKVIVLKTKDKWNYVSVKWGKNGWIKGGTYTIAADTKSQAKNEVYIAGIGKCLVEASSTLEDSGGYSYSPTNLFDKNPGTTWQVSKGGIGEWVEITFPEQVSVSMSIINGFAKVDPKFSEYGASGDLYELNSRVKSLKIEYWGSGGQQSSAANFEDGVRDFQDAGSYRNINKIRLTIDSIYKGQKWDDTAIAEIRFNK